MPLFYTAWKNDTCMVPTNCAQMYLRFIFEGTVQICNLWMYFTVPLFKSVWSVCVQMNLCFVLFVHKSIFVLCCQNELYWTLRYLCCLKRLCMNVPLFCAVWRDCAPWVVYKACTRSWTSLRWSRRRYLKKMALCPFVLYKSVCTYLPFSSFCYLVNKMLNIIFGWS